MPLPLENVIVCKGECYFGVEGVEVVGRRRCRVSRLGRHARELELPSGI